MLLKLGAVSEKNLLFVVNNGRVLLQQPLCIRSENAFFTFKLDQLLVHQLDVALGEIILYIRNGSSKLRTHIIIDH